MTMQRLHIVGCPRSGTTLMMELMVTCFMKSAFCDHEMSLFDEPENNPKLFFSKQPSDIKFLEHVFPKDPTLYVLYMVRDPRSVITSIHGSRPDEYFCNYRAWQACADAATGYENQTRFLKVRYEDLVEDPDAVQRVIMEKFSFLKKIHNFSEYEKKAKPSGDALTAMSGLRAVDKSRVSGWHAHLPRVKAELLKSQSMIDALIVNGYEPNRQWTKLLDDVDPVEYPCRYPEKDFFLKTLETRFRKWRASRRYLARRKLQRAAEMDEFERLESVDWQYLSDEGRLWLDDFFVEKPSVSTIKDYPKRKVCKAAGVFIKIVRYRGWLSIFKTIHKGNACKEGEMTRRMAALGVSVPVVLGYGTVSRYGLLQYDVVLTQEVADCRTLRELVDQDWSILPPSLKRRLIETFGKFVKSLHEAGVVHKDPHLGNILYRSGIQAEPFVILDTDQVTLQSCPLEETARLRNLALFPSLKYSPSRTEILRFLKGYQAPSGQAGTSFRQKYAEALFEHASKLYRKHAGRSVRTNSRFCKESVSGFQVYRKANDETASILSELLPDPDLLLEQGEIYKAGRTARAAKVTICGKSYFLKRFNTKSFWYRFRNAFRSSRAVRAWVNNWEFKYRNLPVPEPILCLEERRCRLLGRSYLLTEFYEDSEKLKTRWQEYTSEQQETMLIRIAILLARMHRLGCVHGDLKWANVLVKGDTPYLIDLDGSRVLKSRNLAACRKDLSRFLVDIDKYSKQSFRFLFLKCWEKHLY